MSAGNHKCTWMYMFLEKPVKYNFFRYEYSNSHLYLCSTNHDSSRPLMTDGCHKRYCICQHVCVRVCIYMYICLHMHIQICVYIHTYMCMCTYICKYTHLGIRMRCYYYLIFFFSAIIMNIYLLKFLPMYYLDYEIALSFDL